MRTKLSEAQVDAIITEYFYQQDSIVHFIMFIVADSGEFEGCLVDHQFSVKLPEVEE